MDKLFPISLLADQIERLDLEGYGLVDEYRYASLPLCVIDAVFSIGVRYSSTQKVVENFCAATGWQRFEKSRELRGPGLNAVSEVLELYEEFGVEGMADELFRNRQRTSTKSGILKSEAVLRYCQALSYAGIDNFEQLFADRKELAEAQILGIPGQSSGIAFDYFMMLAGDDSLVKPDRMVQRFVQASLSLSVMPQPRQTAILVRLAAKELNRRGFKWTPLRLDYAIWSHQRSV